MDTDAIYSAVLDYGAAKRARFSSDEELDHRDRVKRLLNEAEAEHKSLLATNEKLVDEVADLKSAVQIYLGVVQERNSLESENAELKAKLTKKAELLRGCYARIDKLEKAVNGAIPAMREYARKNPKHYWNDAQQDPNGAHAWLARNDGAALEKKHEN